MEFGVEAVPDEVWPVLGTLLRQAGYTTEALRAFLSLSEPVEEVVKNTGRYSLFYLDELAGTKTPLSVLARLFLLSARVPAADLGSLDDALEHLLRRVRLVVPAEDDLVCGAVAITELRGSYFLSDALFENTGDDVVLHDPAGRCMPPHASSLELLDTLRRPDGASSFLDVGCGSGCQSLLFARDYQRVEGFDVGSRQVLYARANAGLNAVPATYDVAGWETFLAVEQFDHVAFNSPNAEVAFAFLNGGLSTLLGPLGHAQLWITCERTESDRDWTDHVTRRLHRPEEWTFEILVHEDSPFALPTNYLRERRLPTDTLLVDHPSKASGFLRALRRRGITEVASLTLTISRRTAG